MAKEKWFRRLTKKFFIIINLIFSVFFMIACFGGRLDPYHFWFVGLLILGAIVILAALLLFILFWLIVKPRYMLISMLTLAICWNPLKHLIRLQMVPDFVVQKNESQLRVLDWNVDHFNLLHYKTDPTGRQRMFNIINHYNPDVACFQEATMGDSSPTAINKVYEIKNSIHMSDYHFSYNKKLDFDKDHRYGIVIYSKYPIISKHTISYEPYSYNSIFQYVDIVKGPIQKSHQIHHALSDSHLISAYLFYWDAILEVQ